MQIGRIVVIDPEDVFPPLTKPGEVGVAQALGIAQPQPVSIDHDVFQAQVAAVHAIQPYIFVFFKRTAFGQLRHERVHREHVGGVRQANRVEGKTGEARGSVIHTNQPFAAEAELLAANTKPKRQSEHLVRLDVGLVDFDVVCSRRTEVRTGDIVRTKILAPDVVGVDLDERADFIREVRFHVQASAMLDITERVLFVIPADQANNAGRIVVQPGADRAAAEKTSRPLQARTVDVRRGIHVVVAPNANLTTNNHILQFGERRRCRKHYHRCKYKKHAFTHRACSP